MDHIRALPEQKRVLSDRSKEGLQVLIQDIRTITAHLRVSDIATAVKHVPVLSVWDTLQRVYTSVEDSLQKLMRIARLETDTTAYLDNLLLSRSYDPIGAVSEHVSLMTLHAAKGLEFPVVFIVGCENELLPLQYPGMGKDREEERRLFYVGMTRAKEQLYFVRVKNRMLFGSTYQTYPSPFLADIEEQLKHYEQKEEKKKTKKDPAPSVQIDLFG
ncbi:uncharacterized protein METZ01_LOCUS325934 [marine metagenome]|uniref:UvrD-like helicase C-terminal domain-containing protein n=1 Tax=marine metagenome TaxID=408172 RepID=A0A382PJX7_9ZZZZ